MTDAEGRYTFTTIKPGPYPWGNHHNAWRPAHIHFSLLGRAFAQRLVTQMYFPGDPFFPYDPIFNSVRDAQARERMISRFDIEATQPDWAAAYAFDMYLRGPAETPMQDVALMFGVTPSQTVGPYFAIGLPWPEGPHAVAPDTPGAIWIRGHVYDGAGEPVPDHLIETWQADPDGRFNDMYGHGGASALAGFRGFARVGDRGQRGPLRAPHGQAGRGAGTGRSTAGAPHRRVRVRARNAAALRDPDLLRRRARGQRDRPGAGHRGAGAPADPAGHAAGRRLPL